MAKSTGTPIERMEKRLRFLTSIKNSTPWPDAVARSIANLEDSIKRARGIGRSID